MATVQNPPGVPHSHDAVTSPAGSLKSPTARSRHEDFSEGEADGQAQDYDPSLRWRCKEHGCGAAFLTREQLRTHMKMGSHGVGAPPVEEVEAASRERRSLRVPPRSGGYTLRGRNEDDSGDEGERDENAVGSPDNVNELMVPKSNNIATWNNDPAHLKSKAARLEADEKLAAEKEKAQRRREAEWAAQLKVAQDEVARQKREDNEARDKRRAEEQAVRLEQDEKVQREVVEKTMERLNKWKKQRT